MDTTRTMFVESLAKTRQISQHRVKIFCRKLDIDILPTGLSPNENAVLGYLSGRKIIRKNEMDDPKGLSALGLRFVILDFDVGLMYGVYYGEE